MIDRWTYCKKDIPEYLDLVKLARAINYNKRRMMSIYLEPGLDVFALQEAVSGYMGLIEDLSSEYRYMIVMYIGGDRIG